MSRSKLLAIVIVAVGLVGQQAGAIYERQTAGIAVGQQITSPAPPRRGLAIRLSEGAPAGAPAAPRIAAPPAAPLGEAEIRRLLDRLPPLEGEAAAAPFAYPARTLPAPRAGKTTVVAFPPDATAAPPDARAAGPLQVLRRAPEGEVGLAPNLSVTFSQPMVAVTSIDELARTPVPVRLDPIPPGEWRWVGTKTVVFEPVGRFPMATEFGVDVPAGTRSASGATLATAVRWTFSTPPLTLETSHPRDEVTGRQPLMVAVFDQRVDAAVVLRSITVRALGRAAGLRLATDAELKADREASAIVAKAQKDRAVAFTVAEPLPTDATIRVAVEAGARSAEGPRTTVKRQEWSFRTFGPLRVTDHTETPTPFEPVRIDFSNQLDARAFRREWIRMAPAIDEYQSVVSGDSVLIRGAFRPRTAYTITLGAELLDTFGQTLGRDQALKVSVGAMPPSFQAPLRPLTVLDPAGPPRVSVYSVAYRAIKVQVNAVGPSDWEAFQRIQREYRAWNVERRPALPGRKVWSATVPVKGGPDDLVETEIDLAPAVRAGGGQLVLRVEPEPLARGDDRLPIDRREGRPLASVAWIQVTRLAVEEVADNRRMAVWVTSLADGSPVTGARVALFPTDVSATTGSDGLCRLDLSDASASLLVVRKGDDVVLLPRGSDWRPLTWARTDERDSWRWFVFDDRGIYRPGETVHVKGWARRLGAGSAGDVQPVEPGASVKFTVRDARRNEIKSGTLALNRWGAFDVAFVVPKEANLGQASIELVRVHSASEVPGGSHRHSFQIQDFRTPEFEVKADNDGGPHIVGGHATATVSAAYYAGGALPGAPAHWTVRAQPGHFAPPNWGEYSFGGDSIWTDEDRGDSAYSFEEFGGTTDGAGLHRLRIDFDRVNPPRAMTLTAEATVTDVNRQAWAASTTTVVHPADLYVGIKLRRPFVQKGQPVIADLIVADLDGRPIAGRTVDVRLERMTWEQVDGKWTRRLVDPQERRLESGAAPVECEFAPKVGGSYVLTARVTDTAGRANETVETLWVAGGERPSRRGVEDDTVTLVANKDEYRPGETAEILVVAPFTPAEGLLTLGRSGIVRTERFRMTEATTTLRIPIEAGWLPNVHARVDLVGADVRDDAAGRPAPALPQRPARASGAIGLAISTSERSLSVEVKPGQAAIEPGGKTTVAAAVADREGRPVGGAEVALFAVDEAVLSLTGYQLADPVALFYASRESGTEQAGLRGYVMLRTKFDAASVTSASKMSEYMERGVAGGVAGGVVGGVPDMAMAPAPAMAPSEAGAAGAPIHARSNFDPLALFVGSAETGADGRVVVPVTLPDNLTRYRIIAVAATGTKHFGKGESAITARLPLMVRPSRRGSSTSATGSSCRSWCRTRPTQRCGASSRCARRTSRSPTAPAARSTVPANDRVEVRFPAAPSWRARAASRSAAASGTWADAARSRCRCGRRRRPRRSRPTA